MIPTASLFALQSVQAASPETLRALSKAIETSAVVAALAIVAYIVVKILDWTGRWPRKSTKQITDAISAAEVAKETAAALAGKKRCSDFEENVLCRDKVGRIEASVGCMEGVIEKQAAISAEISKTLAGQADTLTRLTDFIIAGGPVLRKKSLDKFGGGV